MPGVSTGRVASMPPPDPRLPLPTLDGVSPSCIALPPGDWPTIAAFLAQRFPRVPASTWAARMACGEVVDEAGVAVAEGRAYQAHLKVYYYRKPPAEPRVPFEEEVLFQDDRLVVVDKPHFLPVTPGGMYLRETALVRTRLRLGIDALVPVHRLDRETAGLVLFAVRPEDRAAYHAMFRERTVAKVYEAVAAWRPEVPMPRVHRSRLEESPVSFMQMRETPGEANAETAIECLGPCGPGLARYRLTPRTGQRHQLRVHMAALGLPLRNDRIYPHLQPQMGEGGLPDFTRPLQLLTRRTPVTVDVTRRALLGCTLPWWLVGCASGVGKEVDLRAALGALQVRTGGKLGVHAVDSRSGDFISFNAESRFPMGSTYMVLLAAAVLQRVDTSTLSLDQTVPFGRRDLIAQSPVVTRRLADGRMSVRDLLAAILELGDKAAANLLLTLVGGPSAVTDFVRETGDVTTRLDRTEPELNSNLPGDLRDTTTPVAMARCLQNLLLGRHLSMASRAHLEAWMVASTTGRRRLRAGLPDHWRVGDKTGTGDNGAFNNVAVAWPTVGAPLVFSVFMIGATAPVETLEAVHTVVARLAARELASAEALQPSPG
jgi:beta-lactamase class A/23S rRNA-/tRNA-specific pseudouridylate synthase